MKLGLLVCAAALALIPPALAAGPSVHARAYLVEDGRNGEVLLAHNPGERIPIASLTKMMTVLLTLERSRLSDMVTISPDAAAVGESSIGLRAGERISVRDLVEAALIQSANDAAWALADHVGHGSETKFVALMNRRARQLGLDDTHFVRPDGLDAPGHVSSARDVTTLARLLMQKPVVRKIVAMRDATIEGDRHLHTWNDLLGVYPGVIGVKTGHTAAAGWSEAGAVRGPGVTVYATILGSPSRRVRNDGLAESHDLGALAFPRRPDRDRRACLRERPHLLRRGRRRPRRAAVGRAGRRHGPSARRAYRGADGSRPARSEGPGARRGARLRARQARRALAARRRPFDRGAGRRGPRGLVRQARRAQHVGLGVLTR